MKKYQKAELIAKNLPTGSYAAGCPAGHRDGISRYASIITDADNVNHGHICSYCEIAS